MTISGIRHTKNINQDRRVVDMAKKIALLEPNKSPLITLTKRLSTKPTINPIFHWLEDELQAKWSKVSTAEANVAATDLVVSDIELFRVGFLVKVPRTGEIMRVTDVTASTDTITVKRSFGTTAAAAILQNDPIVILGSAEAEGGLATTPLSVVTSTVFNYTQIFKTAVQLSKTQEASELYGGSDRAYQRLKKGIEHAVDLERAAWFGEKAEDNTGSTPVRSTGGVMSFIETNAVSYDASDSLTEDNFEKEFLEGLFRYGSSKKTLFASSRVISVINSWGRDKIQTVVGEETYGLKIYRYISAHGELNIVKHQLFEGAVYGKMGVALDLDAGEVAWRPLSGRDTKLRTGIEPNDADYYLDEYITEGGFQIKLPKVHGIIENVGFPSA